MIQSFKGNQSANLRMMCIMILICRVLVFVVLGSILCRDDYKRASGRINTDINCLFQALHLTALYSITY